MGKKKVDNVNVMDENNETEVEVTVVKTKWSLKKKLMIGGGIFAGLVLGAIALGSKKGGNVDIDQVEDLDNDDEEYNITEEDVEDVETIISDEPKEEQITNPEE